jgi:transmembrane sensor
MSLKSSATAPTLPSSASLEAAAWITRLNADDRTPAVDAAFHEWLSADSSHRAAFEAANRMWEYASTLPLSSVARIGHPRKIRSPSSMWRAAVVCGALACLGTLSAFVYLQRASVLQTTTGQQLILPLEDGSRVTLNTDTRLKVRFDENQRRVVLESGEALFEVAKNIRRPFIVQAGDREVTALGTQFIVRYDQQRTAVTLMEGKVSVEPIASAPNESAMRPIANTILHPGDRMTFDDRNVARIDRPALDKVTAWKRGQVAFENTPLIAAIEEMNRYSVHKLTLGQANVGEVLVSGLFQAGDSENFVLALTNLHRLRAVERDGGIAILGPTNEAR